MKKKVKCKICGKIDLPEHFEDYDGGMSMPVAHFPTLKKVEKYLTLLNGESYEKSTGRKIEEMFKKEFISPSHECPDDIGLGEAKKHTLEPIECWVEQI